MEYAYALITPNGHNNGVTNSIVKDLIKEGFDSNLISLICVYDLTNNDIHKMFEKTKNVSFCEQLKKSKDTKYIVPLFFKGNDAVNKVKKIAAKYNSGKINEERYLDNVYVSNDSDEAIEDLCFHFDIENFEAIEDLLFSNVIGPVESYPFKELSKMSNKKMS